MTIVLNGTTGITTPDITSDGGFTADGVSFASGAPSNTLVTTSGGNVGIGTSSPAQKLVVSGSGAQRLDVVDTSGATARLSTASGVAYVGTTTNHPLVLFTNDAERARIDSSGNLLVGTTNNASSAKAVFYKTGGGATVTIDNDTNSQINFNISNVNKAYINYASDTRLYVLNSSAGVYLAAAGTSWTSNSDERVKDIIEPITNAANKISSLRAVIGKFKSDEEGTRRSFLIAQDVQAVLPEAVDANNPDLLGVAYTDVIPLIVAAIKEQQALITQLQADVAALKAKA